MGIVSRSPATRPTAVDALHSLLRDSVRMQLVSDVPLGVLLSGGVDSATVLALAQAESDTTVRSFSIGFPEAGLDEAPDARAIAAHIGSDHTELYVTPEDILELIPALPQLSDLPIADPSYIANYFAYRLAREHVTVALTGDGGDEVFGGYHRHRWLPRVWRTVGWTPAGCAPRARGRSTPSPRRPGTGSSARWSRRSRGACANAPPGRKIQRLARWMACETPEEMYGVLASRWDDASELVAGHDRSSVGAVPPAAARRRLPAGRADAGARAADLPAGRPAHQGRPVEHGRQRRGPGAAAGPPGGGARAAAPAVAQGPRRHGQVRPAQGAAQARSAGSCSSARRWDSSSRSRAGFAAPCASGPRTSSRPTGSAAKAC